MTARCRRCGHMRFAHEHDRPGLDCALCSCRRFRQRWWRRPRVDVLPGRSVLPRGTCSYCGGRHGVEDCVGGFRGGRW